MIKAPRLLPVVKGQRMTFEHWDFGKPGDFIKGAAREFTVQDIHWHFDVVTGDVRQEVWGAIPHTLRIRAAARTADRWKRPVHPTKAHWLRLNR